jgi:hypothetical protein
MNAETEAMKFLAEHGWRGSIDRRAEARLLRDEFRSRFSFAIPDSKTIERLSCFGPLLEVGSGIGYWAWELRRAGVDLVATDVTGKGRYWKSGHWLELWTPIEPLDAIAALRKYPTRTLLSVWPDRGRDWPAQALRAYRGDRVLYVGEGPGGCTGNYEFHKILHDEFACVSVFPIPHFYRQHDLLWIWKRLPTAERRNASAAFGSMVMKKDASTCDDASIEAD